MLDYKLLEALASIISEKGFEKGARSLGLTQSAVSQRIRTLEEQVGQVLLIRSNPPRPTPAGTILLQHYQQVELLERDLSDSIGVFESDYTAIPLGINADSVATWFFPSIEPSLSQHRITLDLRIQDQDQTINLLRTGEVWGSIGTQDTQMQGCSMKLLGTMRYRLYCSPSFMTKWFAHGLNQESVAYAPLVR